MFSLFIWQIQGQVHVLPTQSYSNHCVGESTFHYIHHVLVHNEFRLLYLRRSTCRCLSHKLRFPGQIHLSRPVLLPVMRNPDNQPSPILHTLYLHNRCSLDRKSTRLNSSHVAISYAVFCLKKKKHKTTPP